MLLLKSQNNLHVRDLVRRTELDGLGGTEELFRLKGVVRRDTDVFEIEPRFFVLKQNFHLRDGNLVSGFNRNAIHPPLIVGGLGWCRH
jgi:hypothetical protein